MECESFRQNFRTGNLFNQSCNAQLSKKKTDRNKQIKINNKLKIETLSIVRMRNEFNLTDCFHFVRNILNNVIISKVL